MSLDENNLKQQAQATHDSMQGLGRDADLLQKVLRAVREEYDDQPSVLKRTRDQFGALDRDLRTGRKSYLDLGNDLRSLAAAIEDVEDATQKADLKKRLSEKANEAAIAKGTQVTLEALATFTKNWFNYQISMQKAAYGGYQSGSSVFKVANDAASARLEYLNANADMAANAVSGLAGAAGIAAVTLGVATGGLAALGAVAIGGVSSFISGLYKRTNEKEKARIDIMSTEAENLVKTFNAANSAGAIFVGGMQQFRNTAVAAGLTQVQLSKAIAENAENLRRFGGTTGGALGRYAAANKLVMDQFGKQLMALGMSVDDIAGGTAQYMGILGLAGNTQKMTADQIATDTYSWLKNIRAISAFTGEDAKRAKERADKAIAQTQVYAQLQEEAAGNPKKLAQLIKGFESQLMALTENEQLAFMQQRATGVISDKTFRTADAETGGMLQSRIDKAVELSKTEIDAKKFMDFSKQNAKALSDQIYTKGGTGQASLLGGKYSPVEELKAAVGRQMLIQQGILENTNKTVAKAANTQDKLTLGVSQGMLEWQNKQIEIAQKLDKPLSKFVDEMNDHIIPALEEALRRAGIAGLFNEVKAGAPKEITRPDGTKFNPYEQNKVPGSIFDAKNVENTKKLKDEVEKLAKADYLAWAKNVTLAPTAQLKGTDVATNMERAINAIALTSKSKVIINALDDAFHRSKAFQAATNTKDKDGNIISNPYFDKNGKPTDSNKHAMGLAADISMDGANKAMAAEINSMLNSLGIKATATFESKGEGASTGDHIHIQDEEKKSRTDKEKENRNKKAKEGGAELASVDWDEHRDIQLAQLETMKRLADHLSDISNNTA